MNERIFIVTLRRPRKNDPRDDPYWEFGSFGCTGCHAKNLLHPKKCQITNGDRLAFVQGGGLGLRLLLVTPHVSRVSHPGEGRVELKWDCSKKPFRYDRAPSLFESPGPGKSGRLPGLAKFVHGANRPTVDAKFSSRFRSRTRPLEPELARELSTGFAAAVKGARPSDFIARYEDALPWCDCPTPLDDRKRAYNQRVHELATSTSKRAKSC